MAPVTWANSVDLDETVQMHSLARAFAFHRHELGMKVDQDLTIIT